LSRIVPEYLKKKPADIASPPSPGGAASQASTPPLSVVGRNPAPAGAPVTQPEASARAATARGPRLRRSGVLLHPTSLPGPFGSGDLGASARHFVDWLATGGQGLWQVLPLGIVGPGDSPYMSPSAFAGNPLLVDLHALHEAGWLAADELVPPAAFTTPEAARQVDFAAVRAFRMDRLRSAATCFFAGASVAPAVRDPAAAPPLPAPAAARLDYDRFCTRAAAWLDDAALYLALCTRHGDDLRDWPAVLRRRDPAALSEAARELAGEVDFHRFVQWSFDRQWHALRRYAHAKGIRIVGDVPIFVADNGVDMWAHPELFDLDAEGRPRVIAGVPPDYFSATGQRWGNPLYRWPAHAADGYRWWIARMRHTLAQCDVVRIDHFRGFEAYWEIPGDAETAVDGRWVPGPGAALFGAIDAALAASHAPGAGVRALPVIAEDLGIITAEVTALREGLGLPGMRILQFAFDGRADNPYLPHHFERNTVVYTGTHDNDTTHGWWDGLDDDTRRRVADYAGRSLDELAADPAGHLLRLAFASVADTCIVPMQDALGLGTEARMNRPGEATGCWSWRFSWGQVGPRPAERLRELAQRYGRNAPSGGDRPDSA
jgi:4-alpha-glucanotransferase